MEKSIQSVLLLLVSAVYFVSMVAAAETKEVFHVKGFVYCDKCRAQFNNRLNEPIADAAVKLECRDPEEGHLTFSVEGKTDATGNYNIEVDGDHDDEMCQVLLVSSPRQDCNEIPKEAFQPLSAKVILTTNSGISGRVREANPLGFMVKEAIPECLQLYKELDMLPEDIKFP